MQSERESVRTALEALVPAITNNDAPTALIEEMNEGLLDAGVEFKFAREDSYPFLVSVVEAC